jgi:hypothetical protein
MQQNNHERSWYARYSSCEYLYLDMIPGNVPGVGEVRMYLNHSSSSADRWTFQQLLAGGPVTDKFDAEVVGVFGRDVLDELYAAIRADLNRERLSAEEEKARDRVRRRQEGKPARGKA